MAARRRKSSHARRTKPRTFGGAFSVWLRIPLNLPKGRRLRVLIYARFSTDQQNPRSIDDQVAYCRRFLDALGLKDVEITTISDEGISGELVSRPGIDEVLAGAREGRWDVILCEDASRLYRHETACGELIETAVDEGIRVICINDLVDTGEPVSSGVSRGSFRSAREAT